MKTVTELNFHVECQLTESEVRALDALAGYGLESFLKAFYSGCGRHYLEPHVKGLETLFEKAQAMNQNIYEIDNIRKLISEKIKP
jgi:hypothetical protein